MKEKFSLKDWLFNEEKVTKIANEIHGVYPDFDTGHFIRTTVAQFPSLELKARISWISENLKLHLPQDYRQAMTILLASLPQPHDNS